ncbi:hypothetical protein DEA8626_02159 [Defluviimonas aquaemixtae]|uniref:HMA domain-containing protein n=1 Tax=Albidovulum aquaemixtae TaxID=1542388 RepID=A0A2R8B7R8_9RHOB|nr:heavy-metal-associated domain-containing protein [Defluviimonas aquaemixtae]SPH18619.1 hypothetical protein DEA8626_02159 [Defluviimonas aquaemixtae]
MLLSIPDMSCEHCKATVERTIIDIDSMADVVVSLQRRQARVKTTAAPEAILGALKAAGYPAKRLD